MDTAPMTSPVNHTLDELKILFDKLDTMIYMDKTKTIGQKIVDTDFSKRTINQIMAAIRGQMMNPLSPERINQLYTQVLNATNVATQMGGRRRNTKRRNTKRRNTKRRRHTRRSGRK